MEKSKICKLFGTLETSHWGTKKLMITYIRKQSNVVSKLTTQFCLRSLHSPLHRFRHLCQWPQNNFSFYFSWAPNPYIQLPTRHSSNHLKLPVFSVEIMISALYSFFWLYLLVFFLTVIHPFAKHGNQGVIFHFMCIFHMQIWWKSHIHFSALKYQNVFSVYRITSLSSLNHKAPNIRYLHSCPASYSSQT